MKIPTIFSAISIIFFLLSPVAYAADKTIVIVTNGNTETHRDVFEFFEDTFWELHAPYNLSRISRPERVSNISADVVVVININRSSGIDPVLEKFIARVPANKKAFLINFYRGRKELTILHTPASEHPLHIDALTAASLWDGPDWLGDGPSERSLREMHRRWIIKLIELLEKN